MPKSELHTRFCENIREIRLGLGMTQQDVADILGVSRPYIAELEKGRHAPSLDLVQRCADALGVSADELLSIRKKFAKTG